jgi:3-dehydroquinate synthase
MSVITVGLDRSYPVRIDINCEEELLRLVQGRQRVALFFSENMKDAIPTLSNADAEIFRFPLPDSEEAKSARVLTKVWDWFGAAGFTRSDLVVAIGGGAVTDFAGFAAASWLRGVDWVAVPTTMAGMVDASIGGKTGINSDYGKNLIGAFHSPLEVLIDTQWLTTLSDRDFAAGLAEVVKAGFIYDKGIITAIGDRNLSEVRSSESLTLELIERAVKVKAEVVSSDFKEDFNREILNYGHTFGHAIELDCKYSLRHGECVSVGMVFIAELAFSLGLMEKDLLDLHRQILTNLSLPITYAGQSWENLYANMKIDKKTRGNLLRFVAVTEIGKTQRLEGPSETSLRQAYEKVCS